MKKKEGLSEEKKELSPKLQKELRKFIKILDKTSKKKPITADDILARLNRNRRIHEWLAAPEVRVMTHYIRENGLLPLNTNSHGYYISKDRDDIEETYNTLVKKGNSILEAAEALKKHFLDMPLDNNKSKKQIAEKDEKIKRKNKG